MQIVDQLDSFYLFAFMPLDSAQECHLYKCKAFLKIFYSKLFKSGQNKSENIIIKAFVGFRPPYILSEHTCVVEDVWCLLT